MGGDVNAKTIAGWAAIAFVIWWVIEQPESAAHLVHNIPHVRLCWRELTS